MANGWMEKWTAVLIALSSTFTLPKANLLAANPLIIGRPTLPTEPRPQTDGLMNE